MDCIFEYSQDIKKKDKSAKRASNSDETKTRVERERVKKVNEKRKKKDTIYMRS